MRRKLLLPWVLLTAALLMVASPARALVWAESGAGPLLPSAELTKGVGLPPLTGITGTLQSINDVDFGPFYEVDLFKIFVTDALSFTASTVLPTAADTSLFLFDGTGHAVYFNDDFDGSLLSTLPAGVVSSPGYYFLGISLTGASPMAANGESLFFADGVPASTQPLAWWAIGTSFEESPYAYSISLDGASVAAVPEPATVLLMLAGLAGIAAAGRRRVHSVRG